MLQSRYILVLFILITNRITAQDKIAALDFNKLLKRLPETTQAVVTLKHVQDSLEMEYDSHAKKINNELKIFSDTLCHMGMNPNSKGIIINRKKLLDDITALQSLEKMNQELLKKMTDSTFALVRNKLKASLKQIADENGYRYIFDLHSNTKFPLPICDDITSIVMNKLGL